MKNPKLKCCLIILTTLLPLLGISQESTRQSVIKTVPFKEWSSKYPSVDIKGKYHNVTYVVELSTSDRKSLKEDLEIFYTSSLPEKIKKANWYRWNPLDQCWSKFATPGIEQKNGAYVYKLMARHPGTYALMSPQQPLSKGIDIHAPRGLMIQSVELRQENPGIFISMQPKKQAKIVQVPLTEPQFDTKIHVKLVNRKGETFVMTKRIIGDKIDWHAQTSSQKHLKLVLGTEDVTEFDNEVVLIGN
jgi:hypothetical protein